MSAKSSSPQQAQEPSHQQAEKLERPRVEAMEAILGKPFPVLDDGFIRVIDYMGNDHSVVQAARVSYGKGTKKVHQDRGLIRYLMRHRHTTPFEMCEIKLHVRVPMDTWRQWIRHRTACLAGDTVLSFDEPGAIKQGRRKHRGKTIKELYDQWHNKVAQTCGKKKKPGFTERIDPERKYTIPELSRLVERREEDLRNLVRGGKLRAEKIPQSDPKKPSIFVKGSDWIDYANRRFKTVVPLRSKIKQMHLRMCDEQTGEIVHTHITDIWESGIKPVFKVTLENGYSLKMSKDHLCLTEHGWLTLEQATGLKLSGSGQVTWKADSPAFAVNGIPMHQSKEWLSQQRQKGMGVADIAAAAGVSYHTIRKWLKIYNLQFTEKEKGVLRGAAQRGRKRNSKKRGPLTGIALENVRKARSGSNSNFWKGGITGERSYIGRWTTQNARYVHEQYGYKCAICDSNQALETHHIDPVWNNPDRGMDLDNLITLCNRCHKRIHAMNLELDFLKWHSQKKNLKTFWDNHTTGKPHPSKKPLPKPGRLFRCYSKIARIEYAGEEMTYDLSVEGPYHNFVANGFIVHNSVNEYSTRYSIAIDAAQTTPPDQWRLQATGNRQGSAGFLDAREGEKLTRREAELQHLAREVYEERLDAGVAREQARKDLPLSTYTEAYWKIDLHNLLHFLELRMAPNAQYEIRCYAEIIGREILSRWCPLVWEAFCDYRLNSLFLSGPEIEVIQNIAGGKPEEAIQTAVRYGWLPEDRSAPIKRHREREECEEKLRRLKLPIPWLADGQ